MSEPTKACVRVLKFENKVKYVLLYPFIKFLKFFSRFIDWLVQFINWCIVRAIVRWTGLPVIVWILYEMVVALSTKPSYINGAYDGTPFAIVIMCIIALVFIGGIVLSCWVEVPREEREILTEYLKWF
jgi:hypothetical protein